MTTLILEYIDSIDCFTHGDIPQNISARASSLFRLQSIMAPILERAIALALRVPLGGLFLGKMPLAVRHNLAHVIDFGIIIPRGLATWVVLQNIHDLPTTNLTCLVSVSGLRRVEGCQCC